VVQHAAFAADENLAGTPPNVIQSQQDYFSRAKAAMAELLGRGHEN
jgi:hypothetical protein